jgi:hypothetical protein
METTEILWCEGRFCCQLRMTPKGTYICVSDGGEPIIELVTGSRPEAHQRAAALRLLIQNHLHGIKWIRH